MSQISLRNISTPHCLDNVGLDVGTGELVIIMGSTGAGKSTLLNVIAGLTEYSGEVYFNRKNMNSVRTENRNVGYLFQDIRLFPNMNTYENVAFGLRACGCTPGRIREKVSETLETLRIGHLKDRYPKHLSGGERQRIGLARSIIMEPEVLLLDEPLSSLDPSTAGSIRKELKTLQKRLNLTMLYVTHDYSEARELADRVVVISDGQILHDGSVYDSFCEYAPSIGD